MALWDTVLWSALSYHSMQTALDLSTHSQLNLMWSFVRALTLHSYMMAVGCQP